MSFDIESYSETATPVRTDDLDFDAFRDRPLMPETLRTLRYMHDVESHTVCYLRDLLLTASHKDPRITTFLTMWAYEEHWHGVALGKVLAMHGEVAGTERIAPMRERLSAKDRWVPFGQWLAAGLIGEDFVAVHMTWGALNEWSTQAGYQRLAELDPHPVLVELLSRIARQESRHIAFYASEARERLGRSEKARKITRFALEHKWSPVGSTVMPREETEFLLAHLLGDATGTAAAERIDRRLSGLPGLDGLTLVRRALTRYGITPPERPATVVARTTSGPARAVRPAVVGIEADAAVAA
jgi:hypothetical protein